MTDFLRAGGTSMWLILLVGIVMLITSVSFAWRRAEHKLGMIRPLSLAMVFATLSGICTGLGATVSHIARRPDLATGGDFSGALLEGIGESLAPAILGFAVLTVCWLIVAVGMRRAD